MTAPNRWLPVVGGVMMNMTMGMFYGMSVFMLPLEEFGWTPGADVVGDHDRAGPHRRVWCL